MFVDTKGKAQEVGERIRRARIAKGISQRGLGNMIGLSDNACVHWETGRALPNLRHITALAEVLGVSFACLWAGDESATNGVQNNDAATIRALLDLTPDQRAALLVLARGIKNVKNYQSR